MEHSNNISTINDLAEFIISTNVNSSNNGMTGKSKGDLIEEVYGQNYSNVDSALPLGLLEEMNINNDERWRYVMDYQNGSGGKLTDLIKSLAEKNPYVVIYDKENAVDNLEILSAMEKYKNSNYMFDFYHNFMVDWKKLSYKDFVETLRDYDKINAYTGKTTTGMEMFYLPKGHSSLGKKFSHKNNKKAYKEYLSTLVMADGGSVNDYIDKKIDEFDADETEMRQQYRGYVRDIEYQGFLAIDTSLTPHERLSDYEFDGEEFDRDNLLEVAKMYPQAEYITFHARLMGDSDFGIEDELSPIDDLAMSFDMNKLNQYARGGSINMKKHIWEGWEVQDFIEALDIDFQYAPKFNSREEVKKWSMENQPYYKKYIKEVVDYFWNKTQEKNNDNYYDTGGNVNDYFAILTEKLESKYVDNYLAERFYISNIENGIEIITDEEDVFNEIKEDYANDILFVYPTFYQIEIKYSVENYNKLYNSYNVKADFREITDDRIVVKTDDLQTFEEIREDFNDGEILFVFPPMYKLEIGNFEEFTFEEVDSLLGETLDKYNYNSDAGKDNEDYLYELSKSFSKEDRDILIYALMQNKWSLPQGIRESVELKLLNRRNRKGNNDYKGDINNNGITYYNVGIDEGEDIGTRTLEFFDTKAEAQAFMDKFLLSNPNAKLFIDVETRQPILDKKVIGQQGNVIVNPQEVSSIVEDKIKDFIEYAELNYFDGYVWLNLSLRDYIDEVFNDSPTEVESIEEIDFEDEIENFIIYFTSDEEKREELRNLMLDYLDDDNDTNEEISIDNPRNEVTTNNFYRRLQFINEDIKRVFKYAPKELLDFKVEGWEDIGTLLSNIEIASDLNDNASDDWKGSKINMANGGSVELANEKYLNSIPLDKKTRILQNIADHYGISEEQAYAEITDIESEALYEYITDQNLKMHVYQMMK